VSRENQDLAEQLESIPYQDRILLLGEIDDLRPIYQAIDILVSSSSWGEGFSNVIGEGMASECFCIATNVGEASRIIGDAGSVIAPKNLAALVGAILEGVNMTAADRQNTGLEARKRIRDTYSIERISKDYLDLYR
jgi:glycosyltransferase involved in cell wall biosynthesis